MKKYLPIIIIGALVLIGAGFFSYMQRRTSEKVMEKGIERAIERSGGGDVDVDIDSGGEKYEVTYETDEGSVQVSTKGELPEDFPSDIPVYPGSKVVSTVVMDELGSGNVSLNSEDDSADVTSYYRDELEKNGYKITSFFESEGTSVISAEKGEFSVYMGVVLDDEMGTMIQISYGPSDAGY